MAGRFRPADIDRINPMNIGYIGLGNMGGAVARRLQQSHPLHVFDLSSAAVEGLARQGAIACRSAAEVAQRSDIVFLCLPKSEHVRSVIFGPDGLISAKPKGLTIVDQTTGDPAVTRDMAATLADIGTELCDAPVSGGPKGAAAGRLSMMVGATDVQFGRILPLLNAISQHVFHAGSVGAGQVIKLANNLLHHSQRLLSLEIIALAAKNGIEPTRAVDIILASSGCNYFLQHNMYPRILAGEMQSGFTLDLLFKDISLATRLATASDVPMPLANLVQQLYRIHIGELGGDEQVNRIAENIDRWSGTRVVGSAEEKRAATA